MTNALVPKVTLAESAGNLGVPQTNQVVIGMIGVSSGGTATVNTVQQVISVAQAETLFGANTSKGADLLKMIKRAFQEGASIVKAISIGTPTVAAATNANQGLLTADSEAGAMTATVADATIYTAGMVVYLGTNQSYDREERLVVDTGVGTTVTFTTALKFKHYTGEDLKIITQKTSSAYSTAITAMESDEDKSIVICDLNDDDTAALLKTMCDNSTVNYNTPCVYFRAPTFGEVAATVQTNATNHNSSRVVQLFPNLVDFNGKTLNPGETAAVVTGAIALNGVPWPNHNLTSFVSVGNAETKITDMDALIAAGVTPLELKGGTVHIVRLVTTYTLLNNVPSTLWQEGSVRLNVDYIQRVLARDVQAKFLQKGQNPQTLLALKQEVNAYLSQFASSNILVADVTRNVPAFRPPVVTVDADDATSVTVEIEISPGKPLNFVNLKFSINL